MNMGFSALRQALDEGVWTGFQKRAALLAIMAVVLDGFDIQLLGVAIPAMMKDWGLPRDAFVPVLALSLVAMSVGTAINGWLGDRFGRKVTLVVSMLVFGSGTLAAILTHDIGMFLLTRLVASVGLGGAVPSAIALLSEFTPARRRSTMVTFGMICTPVGGVLAGFVAARFVVTSGWQLLFIVGGVLPIILAIILIGALPESPQFLVGKPHRRAELQRISRKLGVELLEGLSPDAGPQSDMEGKTGYRALLAAGLAKTSILLWVQFLGVLTAAYTVFNWLPTLTVSSGYGLSVGGSALAAFNMGGILGALVGAICIDRYGSRWLTMVFGMCGGLSLIITLVTFSAQMPAPVIFAALFLCGIFIAGLQPMLFALAAHAYATQVRGTGIGAALAIGRLGAIASSVIGSVLIGAGTSAFFLFICALMVIVTVSLAAFGHHVPGQKHTVKGE